MILLYRVLTLILYPLLLVFIYFRKFLKKEDPLRFKEKILSSYFNSNRKVSSKLIWFHAASLGEFKSILPIVESLLNNYKDLEVLITTSTLSSGDLSKIVLKKFSNVHHRYFPYDIEFLIKNFLKVWRPNYIFLVDSEIWPNLILLAKNQKIPLALINARITIKTFNKWIKFPKTAKKIFGAFDLCLTSNDETKHYLKKFEAKNISFHGNIKFIDEMDKNKIKNLNENFLLMRRFWIAASTHQGEEMFCLKTHKKVKERYNDVITFIIPRHINRVKDIKLLADKLNLKTQILNKGEIILNNKEIIIINSFGVLNDYFKYAKSVFVGKSTLKKLKYSGGQNPIDAAKLGCKVYHGPYVYNFQEVYKILNKYNISKEIGTYEELSENLIKDLLIHQKSETGIKDQLKVLGQKILDETMLDINNFVK